MIRPLLLSLALAFPLIAQGEETASAAPRVTAIGVHVGSWHSNPAACYVDSGGPCNNDNPGGYVRLDNKWVVGGYYNSVERPTVYAGRIWDVGAKGPVSLALGGVLATGYHYPIVPLVTPVVSLRLTDRWQARVLYLPRLPRFNPTHVASLALEYRL